MNVEPSVIKKELTDLQKVATQAKNIKTVANKLDNIGSDHIPTTQYRSGVQIKTDLLTRASDLIATAKQGEKADSFIKEAQDILDVALKIKGTNVYSTKLLNGNYHLPSFSLDLLRKSIHNDLKEFN